MLYWKTVGGLEENVHQPEKEAACQAAWEGAVTVGVPYRLQKISSHWSLGGLIRSLGLTGLQELSKVRHRFPATTLGFCSIQLHKHFTSFLEKEPVTGNYQKKRSSKTFEGKCSTFATVSPEQLHHCFTIQQTGILLESCLHFVSFSLALDKLFLTVGVYSGAGGYLVTLWYLPETYWVMPTESTSPFYLAFGNTIP